MTFATFALFYIGIKFARSLSLFLPLCDSATLCVLLKMTNVPKIKLNDGSEIPVLGYGTYKPLGEVSERAVKDAIDCGYRHIDAAYVYRNEAEVGRAIRQKIAENVVTRSEMYITTKLWNTFHEPERVEHACRLSLSSLNLEYIDLYLMHWPFSFPYVSDDVLFPKDDAGKDLTSEVDFLDTWRAMEALVTEGLVRSIGVSNFNSEQLGRLLNACTIKPVMNQVEVSPSLNQRKLIKYCKDNGVEITAYSPLGRPNFETKTPEYIFDAEVVAIGKKYGKSTAQVVLRFLVQLGTIPIPKSQTKERIQQNIDIFDFELTDVEMDVLAQFNNGSRVGHSRHLSHAKEFPFHIEF